jgi:SAM-dependent methyltransferase
MRQAVWRRLDSRFGPGDHILELNCGTGEDALHLAQRGVRVFATDVSAAMVTAARAKIEQAGMGDLVTVRPLAIEDLVWLPPGDSVAGHGAGQPPAFDGALSNFGGLNCVTDLRSVAAGLAAHLRPGAVAMLCVMGPYCAWEWGWYLLRGRPDRAFRRLRRGGVPWHGLTIRYPSIRMLSCAFAPHFRLVRTCAIGAFVPPSYAAGWAARHPRLLSRLNAWERRVETFAAVRSLADHTLLEFERTEAGR